ncbi:hypothetical protein, conserved [Entamoeba dispar SAW760]|uniref:Pre-mRNA-splicing factor CWC21 n=1 Tax=Entamoeba dispar (strain ATCC PRA-260 / SAW760) TaxID=370354 RepID=B0EJI3_ENTDS|nr:uncharacterized protein EDI_165670 [Entamoeba dispar SAW760]EDR25305.1 hypothetical protein, conserved [Entamoeba dispar SAW760]|eukprot:EDR25305.1 hypothetical protein, conserved [Entamoeba dispar SAW760]
MYNNLGLRTVRGTGTSGYVQMSKSYLKKNTENVGSQYYMTKPKKNNFIDQEIVEHELRRKVEIMVLEWAEKNCKTMDEKSKQEKINEQRKYYKEKINDEIINKKKELERIRKACKVKESQDKDFDITTEVLKRIIEENNN